MSRPPHSTCQGLKLRRKVVDVAYKINFEAFDAFFMQSIEQYLLYLHASLIIGALNDHMELISH